MFGVCFFTDVFGFIGLKNVQALQTAISAQTLHYEFPFSSYTFPVDLQFLVLTSRKKQGMVETEVCIPLRPGGDAQELYKGKGEVQFPSPAKIQAFRRYLHKARTIRVKLDDSVGKVS